MKFLGGGDQTGPPYPLDPRMSQILGDFSYYYRHILRPLLLNVCKRDSRTIN